LILSKLLTSNRNKLGADTNHKVSINDIKQLRQWNIIARCWEMNLKIRLGRCKQLWRYVLINKSSTKTVNNEIHVREFIATDFITSCVHINIHNNVNITDFITNCVHINTDLLSSRTSFGTSHINIVINCGWFSI